MLGQATPEQAAPDGAHVHTIITVGNRATGDMLRWEHCDTCPRDADADPEALTVGWLEGDTDRTTTYVPVDFTAPRPLDLPYALDWAEREEWLHHLAGEAWDPDMTDDEYLDMLRPLDDDEDDEREGRLADGA